jgi:pimeloyl-ACP methyl ester carboxylesterase
MKLRLIGTTTNTCCLHVATGRGGEPDVKPVKKTFRAADGAKIIGEVRGKGETALVFLHGWGGDRAYWKNQVAAFADDYRIVAIDQAGHGESQTGRKDSTISALAGDVETVVKELGLKRVILVGHSMGGPIALAAAKRLPGTVVAVIGVDTLQNAEEKIPADLAGKLLASIEKDFKGTIQAGFFTGLLPEKADPELAKWLAKKAEAQEPKMAVAIMREIFSHDAAKLLREAKVPVRCINSAGGYAYFKATAVEINKKYADFAAVYIDAVGHYPMLEKSDEFNRALRNVLKEFATKR